MSIFMQVPGIPGESRDPEHLNWIELIAFSNAPGAGGSTAISFSKMLDNASDKLQKAAANSTAFAQVVIESVSSESVVKQTFKSVVFTSFATGTTPEDGESGGFEAESVKFDSRARKGGKSDPAGPSEEPASPREPQPGKSSTGTGPVGSGEHIVRDGECILSIAQDHGHLFETIWNHPQNAELQSVRKDPNILLQGDRVHIPEKKKKQEACQTAMLHTFRKKGAAKLVLRLVEEPEQKEQQAQPEPPPPGRGPRGRDHIEEDPPQKVQPVADVPRVGVPFKLVIDRFTFSGATDADGKIIVNIPPNARHGQLTIEPETVNEFKMPVRLGTLDPITEVSGVKQRLTNLSFACDDGTQKITPALEFALAAFQEKNGLEVTRQIDEPTRNKLKELHGC